MVCWIGRLRRDRGPDYHRSEPDGELLCSCVRSVRLLELHREKLDGGVDGVGSRSFL